MRTLYNEIDPYCCAWLSNLMDAGDITPGVIDPRPIQELTPDDVKGYERVHFFAGIGGWDVALALAGWPDDRPVWTGSCPCQPFSSAGQQKGLDDKRHLWPAWASLIRECSPATILGEQVAAAIRGGWLDLVFADLEAEGYACASVVLPACGVGAPHIRQRLWFVANAARDGQYKQRGTTGSAVFAGRPGHGEQSANGGATRGVADADRPRPSAGRGDAGEVRGLQEAQRQPELGSALSGRGGATRGVADASHERHERDRAARRRGDGPAHDGATSGVADAGCGGLQQRQRHDVAAASRENESEARQQRLRADAGPSGIAGGLEHAESIGLLGRQDDLNQGRRERSPGQGSTSSGFWSDAEWLPCSDGKARPIEPKHVKMVDGLPPRMGYLRPGRENKEITRASPRQPDATEELQTLWDQDGADAVQGSPGRSDRVHKAGVLQSRVHDSFDGRNNQGSIDREQPPAVSESSRQSLSAMWSPGNGNASICASPGQRPSEQRTIELDDVVRLLPPSLSLAELHGDGRTAAELRALRSAILSAGPLSHPPDAFQTLWASLGEEAKDRLRLGFDHSVWQLVTPHPLAHGVLKRPSKLRAYGNAIVPQVAAEVIGAFMGI